MNILPLRFTEVGSGLVMELGKWYVLSDSGSAYTSQGFDSPEAARHWWRTEGHTEHEWPDSLFRELAVPQFINGAWVESDSPQCMKADDLLVFWRANPLDGCDLEEQYE